MKKMLAIVAGVALAAALAAPQTASANLLVNGSLETTLTPDQYDMVTASTSKNANALAGWTITSGSIDVTPNSYWQSTAGTYSVDLIGSPGIGTISQTITTVIGDTYNLTFDLAFNPETLTHEESGVKHMVVTATAANAAVDGTQTFSGTAGAATLSNLLYTTQTFQFIATSAATTLSLAATLPSGLPSSYTAGSVFCGPIVDNLDLEVFSSSVRNPPSVPEPASLSLLGLGAIGLLRRRSRRRA